jgi:hypothetical protein
MFFGRSPKFNDSARVADAGRLPGQGFRIGKIARTEQEGNQVERVGETPFNQPAIITVA